MTAKSSRRVVIINNIKSDKIEQAIFILRGGSLGKPDSGIIKEAQDIIDEYVKKVGGKTLSSPPPPINSKVAKRQRINAGLLTVMVSAVLLSLVFLVRFLAG